MKASSIGSTFESWLSEEGVLEEVNAAATNRASVRTLATATFGSEEKAVRWLATPLQILHGATPLQVISKRGGAEVVETILTRIGHNIPS